MTRGPDIIASVRFYPVHDGGREGSTSYPIFRCPLEFEGERFDCGLLLDEVGPLAPGMTASVPIILLSPALIKSRLRIGSKFTLWEIHPIAEGVVERILSDR